MSLPPLIQAEQLASHLGDSSLLVIDASSPQNYAAGHIPGSVHLHPGLLQCGIKPAPGKIPDREHLTSLFSALGLRPDLHVVASDDEGGGWAGRLIWTLDCIGHQQYSLLDGGLVAWSREAYPVERGQSRPEASQYAVTSIDRRPIASLEEILPLLHKPDVGIWDARSAEEYDGSRVLAARGGHIPGAAHLEWTDLMDQSRNLRLLPLPVIQELLDQRGLSSDKRIITHCQSHHRSGLSYVVARLLGYTDVKAYDGSWSEWGNRNDTPVE